jgi:hypothetical protein
MHKQNHSKLHQFQIPTYLSDLLIRYTISVTSSANGMKY